MQRTCNWLTYGWVQQSCPNISAHSKCSSDIEERKADRMEGGNEEREKGMKSEKESKKESKQGKKGQESRKITSYKATVQLSERHTGQVPHVVYRKQRHLQAQEPQGLGPSSQEERFPC